VSKGGIPQLLVAQIYMNNMVPTNGAYPRIASMHLPLNVSKEVCSSIGRFA